MTAVSPDDAQRIADALMDQFRRILGEAIGPAEGLNHVLARAVSNLLADQIIARGPNL